MKRTYKLMTFLLITAIIMSFFTGVIYCDDDRSYFINSFHVNAAVDSTGSMDVEETLSYKFSGHYNGVYRTLLTTGSEGIGNISVYSKMENKLIPFQNNESGVDNTYQILVENNGIRLKIFSSSEDETKQFVIKYTVLNVATRYNDTAELYWKFMGKDTDVKVYDFDVNVKLPKGAAMEDIKAFAHGPLSGNVKKLDGQTVNLHVNMLLPKNFVEARLLFPTTLLSQAGKVVQENRYNTIMAEEKKFTEQANTRRMVARGFVYFSFILAAFELMLIFLLYFKYDREYKTEFQGEYYRELPVDYSPAVLSVLWNYSRIKPRDITATLLDLVRKKYLTLKIETREIKGLIKNKLEKEYVFELNDNINADKLTKQEKYMIDWIIGTIGDGKRTSLHQIEGYAKTKTKAKHFKEDYDTWVEYVKLEAEKYEFFDKSSSKGGLIGVLVSIIGFAYGIFTGAAHMNFVGMAILMVISLTLFVYSCTIKRRTMLGVEQYKKWKAFNRFLRHFSTIDKKDLPEVVLWEHYLVYAITLGSAKEVIKELKLVYNDADFNNRSLTFMYYGYYGHGIGHFDAINEVTDTIVKTTESTYTQAMSQLSSASGAGGGFSGGGGGGGGGGGAGAF